MTALHTLPEAPSLEHLRNQARSLQKNAAAGSTESLARIGASHPRFAVASTVSNITLADAQLVVAREYGFDSWPKLKAHVEAKTGEMAVERFKAAVNSGDSAAVGRLLKEFPALKRNIDAPLFSFDTPAIVKAASANDRAMIDVLLGAGANVNARTSWEPGGFGALENSNAETADYLISRGANVDIHAAAKHGKLDRVRELVEADPSLVNVRGGDGKTPLHFASNVEICAYLLEHGAELNTRDIDHNSTAAQYSIGNPEKLRYLADSGAEVDIFIACRLGDVEMAGRLLERYPDCLRWRLNHPDFQGLGGHIYMYHVSNAVRPITIAADHAGRGFYEALLRRVGPVDRLLLGCAFVDRNGVGAILRDSPDVLKSLSLDDAAFISDAAWENRIDAVRAMLDAGFDIDARGMEDGTALERAAVRGWARLVKLLVDRGASLGIPNKYGGEPLGAAIWGSENWPRQAGDHVACVETLIAAGSKLPDRLWGSAEVRMVLQRFGVGSSSMV